MNRWEWDVVAVSSAQIRIIIKANIIRLIRDYRLQWDKKQEIFMMVKIAQSENGKKRKESRIEEEKNERKDDMVETTKHRKHFDSHICIEWFEPVVLY